MIQKLLKLLDKISSAEKAYAHCDVPCGIYETGSMLTAVATIEKMVQKIQALQRPAADAGSDEWNSYNNSLTRMILEKEEQGEIAKRELLILWTDYFSSEGAVPSGRQGSASGGKVDHSKMFPDLHEKVWKTAKLVSKCKQSVDMKAVEELKDSAHEIAHYFDAAEAAKK